MKKIKNIWSNTPDSKFLRIDVDQNSIWCRREIDVDPKVLATWDVAGF